MSHDNGAKVATLGESSKEFPTSLPDFSLANRVAMVTGARRGISRTVALAFARAGADVALCDVIDDGDLSRVAAEIRTLGRRALAVKADISRGDDVDLLTRRTQNELGSIDILLNGAAITKWMPIVELEEDDWDRIMAVNLKGYFLCAKAAAKVMKGQKRGNINIINVASIGAFKPRRDVGAYCIAKAGVVMLTKVMASELAQYGIRVNALAPALVRTEISRPIWEDAALLKEQEAKVPLGSIAEPEDMVGAALFLASDASTYVTGHTLVVDGGFLV